MNSKKITINNASHQLLRDSNKPPFDEVGAIQTATYQVSGLTRTIDVVKDAGSFSLFMGQYINTITIDQIVGDADFYVQIYESGELIYTTPVESNGATVRYVNRREF